MIIDSVFQEFIKVVQENRNYTIGLVNGDGKVTACSDENLIGSVQNVDAPDSNNLFYRIRVKNVDYGWLWLYGKDENLEMMGNLINDSLSIRLTYEITQNMMNSTSTDDDQLMKLLLDNDLMTQIRFFSLQIRLDLTEPEAGWQSACTVRRDLRAEKYPGSRCFPKGIRFCAHF